MTEPLPTKAAWIERIAPALAVSPQEASRVITNHPAVQSWLQTASFEAAMSLETTSDIEMATQAYANMLDDLTVRFAALVEAVHDVTDGSGQLGLDWRPLAPQFSALHIDFGYSTSFERFYRLTSVSQAEAARAVRTVAEALPAGAPFPNRPNEAAGVVVHEGRCLAVRVEEHYANQAERRRTYTLLPRHLPPAGDLAEAAAVQALLTYFASSS